MRPSFRAGVAVLLHQGVVRLERVARDGMRVRASAGAASFRRGPSLRTGRRPRAGTPCRRGAGNRQPGGRRLAGADNPTGTVFTEAEMQAVAEFVCRHDLLLIADEAYDHLIYDGRPMISAGRFDTLADHLLLVNTCSKTFAMTGWRVGYLAGRSGPVRGPSVMHRTSCGFVNTIAQRAAVAAYMVRTDSASRMSDEYAARRDLMCDMVNAMPGLRCEKPEGAFYVFVRVEARITSEELTEHCLRHGVAVRSGTEFGSRGEGFIRLTFAGAPSQFEPGLQRLEKAMRSL